MMAAGRMAKASCCGKSTMKAEAKAKMRKMYAIMKFRTLIDTVLGFEVMLAGACERIFSCQELGFYIQKKETRAFIVYSRFTEDNVQICQILKYFEIAYTKKLRKAK